MTRIGGYNRVLASACWRPSYYVVPVRHTRRGWCARRVRDHSGKWPGISRLGIGSAVASHLDAIVLPGLLTVTRTLRIMLGMGDRRSTGPDHICLFAAASAQHRYFRAEQARSCGFAWDVLTYHA
jgi:hypothetical protein